ncbi:MAG: hypothetical protein JJU11_08360 [Candidatus Sumerlaeia bacterium]|nr:hypothetical protein [Candidatus Sumerlaeia bacterium]
MRKNTLLLGAGTAAVVIISGVIIFGGSTKSAPDIISEPIIEPEPVSVPSAPPPVVAMGPELPSEPVEVAKEPMVKIDPADDWKNEHNIVNGMDPEDQPRTYYNIHFHSMTEFPEGFEADGVVLTSRGVELAPHAPGEEGRRMGSLISAPETFDFPSNAFAPMWLEDVPEGTAIMIEVAVSPDGENWSDFQYAPIDVDHALDIQEYYPDGSPNPNYGYVPGAIYAFGDLLYSQMRYRVTMVSDTDATPSMAAYRTYYMDSTLGSGRMATADELPQPLIFDENPLDTPSDFELSYQPDNEPNTVVE